MEEMVGEKRILPERSEWFRSRAIYRKEEELGFAVHRYMNVLLSFISSTYEKPLKDTSRNACIYVDGIKVQK
jgi:hypothetical protein